MPNTLIKRATMPRPPIDPDDIARYLRWQQAWTEWVVEGFSTQEATIHANQALHVTPFELAEWGSK